MYYTLKGRLTKRGGGIKDMMDTKIYKDFLLKYTGLLEEILERANLEMTKKYPNIKFISDLRIAERSFNFLLNNYSIDRPISETFGLSEWNDLKKRRDYLASKVSDMIEGDERARKRFEGYCDNLKKTRALGSLL